jgi:dephospho-CoA kinase
MKHIGITGNIGSGKSTVCRVFELLDIPVFYADIHARMLLSQADVKVRLTAIFGRGILDDRQEIDRKKLADIVFYDASALNRLNAIIHPLVHNTYHSWVSQQNSTYILYESAILFESVMSADFEKVILVTAPKEIRINRVCARDHISREQVLARMSNQMAEEALIKKADFIIENDGDTLLIPQVLKVDEELRAL